MNTDQQNRIMGNAYRIFYGEFARHLDRVRDVLNNLTDENREDNLLGISTSFHTIKGGAGFFALTEVAKIAGELEDLCSRAVDFKEQDIETVRQSVEELEKLRETIPKPSA